MTTAHARITTVIATASFQWSVDVRIEPGSVEDRPMQYAHGGKTYRPARILMSFRTGAKAHGADRLTLTSGLVAGLQEDITLSGLSISGPRVLAGGRTGVQDHTERFYGDAAKAPDWARFIIEATLNTLHGN